MRCTSGLFVIEACNVCPESMLACAMQRTLLVVAKRPAAGQTKTRLCPPLSGAAAAALYECFLLDTLDIMRQAPGVERGIVYLPDDAEQYFRTLAPDMALTPQRAAAALVRCGHRRRAGAAARRAGRSARGCGAPHQSLSEAGLGMDERLKMAIRLREESSIRRYKRAILFYSDK